MYIYKLFSSDSCNIPIYMKSYLAGTLPSKFSTEHENWILSKKLDTVPWKVHQINYTLYSVPGFLDTIPFLCTTQPTFFFVLKYVKQISFSGYLYEMFFLMCMYYGSGRIVSRFFV